ncbi:Mannose-6-phosphate isomerase [Thalictrum thalictroides]|uniref:Mannose-6-phosphate isomerase n=1 Tax=Thalictrum thalictroides TaxID=46969 RepID=A0A7J6WBH7_THATH|nr:Mannose-6-phosphate isomerase [Thalictrum thalictroides]
MEKELVSDMKKHLPLKLRCSVQHYDWGKIGQQSEVARLFSLNSGLLDIEADNKPYAELWMGTHESGPSFVVENGKTDSEYLTLNSWISENPSVLGDKVVKEWGNNLPFLFKVLSVAKALSIQAHPDKELARALHASHPNLYKDDNHKPEMALALTKFEALCGFVSLKEFKDVFSSVPEIAEFVGNVDADQNGEEKVKDFDLKSIFTQLMSADKYAVAEMVNKLKTRLTLERKVRQLTDKEEMVLQLDKQYPNDVGVISAFFFNYVKLNPGEALYLAANEPHAYLSGECIECMATSDNVVRAGLTPKLRDVPTLSSMLTYKQGFPKILQGITLDPYTKRYSPPFDEFEVDCCVLPQGASTLFPAVSGPSIVLVTCGEGTMQIDNSTKEEVREGGVFFVPAYTEISITCISDLRLYRAGVNSRFL